MIQENKVLKFSHDPLVETSGALVKEYDYLLKNGYSRVEINGVLHAIKN